MIISLLISIPKLSVVFQFSNSSHFNISEDSGTVIICLDRVNGASTEEVIIKVNLIVNDTAATC